MSNDSAATKHCLSLHDHDCVIDTRGTKSAMALHRAFLHLLMEQPYDTLTIRQIADHAGVARSTFYEQFRGKDELLIAAMEGMYAALSRSIFDASDLTASNRALSSLWEKRALLRPLSEPRLFAKILAGFDRHIRRHLQKVRIDVSARALSNQLACATLPPINAWLRGELRVTQDDLARLLLGAGVLLRAHCA